MSNKAINYKIIIIFFVQIVRKQDAFDVYFLHLCCTSNLSFIFQTWYISVALTICTQIHSQMAFKIETYFLRLKRFGVCSLEKMIKYAYIGDLKIWCPKLMMCHYSQNFKGKNQAIG